jgi:drug/metabolite transporter (DMT)-like permease
MQTEKISLQNALGSMLIAAFCFALTGALARILEKYPSVELVFFRNVIGIGFVLYTLRKWPIQKGGKTSLLIFRGLIGTIALYFFFYGVTTIGLAEAITYQQSYPIFLAVITSIFLKEKISNIAWMAILLGFIGLCMVFVPKMSGSLNEVKSHVIGLCNLIFTGMAYLSIRGLAEYYHRNVIVLSFMVCGIVLPIISMILGHYYSNTPFDYLVAPYIPLTLSDLPYFIVFGLAAVVGQIFLTKAMSHPSSGVVGAMGYSNIVFSIIFGVLLGDKMPSFLTFIGIGAIIVSGVLVSLYREQL